MTIKVYKKKTHWYYTYHCEEYDLGKLTYLDFFETLLDSKVLYFVLKDTWRDGFVGKIEHYFTGDNHFLDPYPFTTLIPFKPGEDMYPSIKLPVKTNKGFYFNYKSCIK